VGRACRGSSARTAKILLDAGANINNAGGLRGRGNKYAAGFTPLHWAAYLGCGDLIRLLAERGANLNAQDQRGHTPMHVACIWAQSAASELLVELGASCDIRDRTDYTPADLAREAYANYHFESIRPKAWWATPLGSFPGPGAWLECEKRVRWAEEDRAVRNRKKLEMLASGGESNKRAFDQVGEQAHAQKRPRPAV
jgi:hypothetical protein